MQHLTGSLIFFQDLIPVPVILVETVHVLFLMKGTRVTVHQVFQEETVTKVTKCEFYKSGLGYLYLFSDKLCQTVSHVLGDLFYLTLYIEIIIKKRRRLNSAKENSARKDPIKSYDIYKCFVL